MRLEGGVCRRNPGGTAESIRPEHGAVLFLVQGGICVYKKVPADMKFAKREEEVLAFWRENDIFEKTLNARRDGELFMFYDGPPTANGQPHIGHVETRAFKDLIPRHRTMKGYNVPRKAGWDTHGLPVELEVEKALGLDGKPQIETYGVEPFIKACKESVWKYKTEWEEISERVGFWADMQNPYITYENDYIESVWWSLKTVFEKGLLYRGHKTVPYCPRCGTALSSHEVAQGYQDVTDATATVKFRVKGRADTYLLAWTTTPWTLPSNVALVVNADEDYVFAQDHGETYILAKALVEKNLCEHAQIVKTLKGKELVGMDYEPLYPFAGTTKEKGWYVTADGYVTLSDGTGIVHCAPAFGEDDARVGRDNQLPFVQLVDAQGKMTAETGAWAGLFVKDADPLILQELKDSGRLLASEPYTHSYPFCWRCDTPLIYYARASWFIRMTDLRDNLVANNRSVNWFPDNIKEGRMGNFVENVVDWAVSRERYWGTPLPLWQCGECGHLHAVGSIAELRELGRDVPEDIELHKPYVDAIELTCEKCQSDMHRVPEVIDCWYDAGSMPFAQFHYPFENKELFERMFPAAFISEAIDQTRGWFYTLLAIGTFLFDRAPYENCLVLGHVQDKDGLKMSKHLGNGIAPWDALGSVGADAVRWYFYVNGAPWLPKRFSLELVSEMQRKFMGTLWNTYAFYILYADIDGFDPTIYSLKDAKLSAMDRWALSKLNSLVRQVDGDLTEYRVTEAARAMQAFVDDLSNWYVRRGRERYWGKEMTDDKIAAYVTLFTALETLARLCAPFTPFIAEQMYQNLVRSVDPGAPASVHLCDYPVCDPSRIDKDLENQMGLVLDIVNLARAARAKSQLKTRQPLSALYVKSEGTLAKEYADLVADELNVKEVKFTRDTRDFTTYRIKPQLRTLGPRYGKILGALGQFLAAQDGNAVVDALDAKGEVVYEVQGTQIRLSRDDLLIDPIQKEGYVSETDRSLTVVLDANLTDALIEEGLVREVISKLQTMRKDSGCEVTDRIRVFMRAGEKLTAAIRRGEAEVLGVVLGDSIAYNLPGESTGKEWDVNGETAVLTVVKV